VTLDELYDFVYEHVVNETPKQTPGKWSYKQQGEIIIARNPRPIVKRVDLPSELQQSIKDSRPWVREGAARELDRLLRGSDLGLAMAAYDALKRLTKDDSRRVSTAANESLAAYAAKQRARAESGAEKQQLAIRREITGHTATDESRTGQLVPERARTEQRSAPLTEALAEEAGGVVDRAPAVSRAIWWPMLLSIIGWGVGYSLGTALLGPYTGPDGWALTGAIGGLTTGLALWQIEPVLRRQQVLIVAGGWGLLGIIAWAIAGSIAEPILDATDWAATDPSGWYVGTVIGWFVGWAIFAVTAGLVLSRIELSTYRQQTLTIVGGWFIAGIIGWLAPQTIAGTIEAFASRISPDEQWTVAEIINHIIAWISAGGIGGGVMFWQLERDRLR
jgi:hypothetical protein